MKTIRTRASFSLMLQPHVSECELLSVPFVPALAGAGG
jgi:hypothetical protein